MRFPFLLVFLILFAAPANARSLYVKYDGSLMGLKIGEAKLSIDLNDKKYSISGQAEMTSFGNLVSDGSGTVRAYGALSQGVLKPAAYNLTAVEDGKPNKVNLRLQQGVVTERRIQPEQDRMDQRIKVTKDHKRGIVDPLSALLFVAPKGVHRDSCNRTVAIYDGRDRFDIVMRYKSTYRHKAGKKRYSGDVLTCSARYKAIAGHRPNRKTIQQLEANNTMEIQLAEIPGTPYLLLYRVSLMTPAGKAVIQNVKYKFMN